MKSISITEKLILYFVLLGVIVIFVVGTYSYHFSKQALLNRTYDQLISLRIEKKNRIEQFFEDREREISLISKSPEIQKVIHLLGDFDQCQREISKIEKDSYISKHLSSYGYYQKLYIIDQYQHYIVFDSIKQIDNHHSIVDILSDFALTSFYHSVLAEKNTLIQDLSKNRLFLYIGAPIYNVDNQIIGAVVLEIPFEAINNIMFEDPENSGLGKTGETYLVGNDLLMRSNSRFKDNAVSNIKVETEAVQKAFLHGDGIGIVKDYRDISVLSSYSKVIIKGLNWVILAEIDEKEAMIPIFAIRNSILLISIIIVSMVFIFAFFMSRQITSPIKKLKRASEQIGKGNYEIELPVTSLDEIGVLTETFNQMTQQLKKQSEEIQIEKKRRMTSLIDGQEMERQRLSRDLHDGLGQSLLAVKIKLEQTSKENTEKNLQLINETKGLLKEAIQEIRNVSNDLMPAVLEAFGIREGINNLCHESSHNTGIKITFCCSEIPDHLDPTIQIYLYRITQEAINNIAKHAQAKQATVELSFEQNLIRLRIADNGKGFVMNPLENKGNGIINIKQRVELLNGTCEFESKINKGTTIDIQIPSSYEFSH
jgi:signal transduction histidine kinase